LRLSDIGTCLIKVSFREVLQGGNTVWIGVSTKTVMTKSNATL